MFAGEFEDGIRQIGNCVPPVFMKAIAQHIGKKLLAEIAGIEQIA
jgi:site-specific DNA-cytosine methylase